jgi:hypothetical protein
LSQIGWELQIFNRDEKNASFLEVGSHKHTKGIPNYSVCFSEPKAKLDPNNDAFAFIGWLDFIFNTDFDRLQAHYN